jgi:regulator of protease activity HflC (stomatin/prohibitin superfamily)
MDVLFQFFIDAIDRLTFWEIIQPDERGVRTTLGKHAKVLDPGVHLVWPVIGNIVVVTVVEQSLRISSQSLVTHDGRSIGIGVTVAYEILDPIRAVHSVEDWDESLRAEITGVVGECVIDHTYEELRNDPTVMNRMIKDLREVATQRWGLKILRVRRSDFAPCKTIRLMKEPDQMEG